MTVHVVLYATLVRHVAGAASGMPLPLEVPAGTRLADLYGLLGIPGAEVKQAFVHGRQKGPDYLVQEGDRIALFPPVAGG